MFTKKKWVGSAHAYRTYTDWNAVGGAIVIGFFVLAALSQCSGG
jgi:hypothetical protein